MFDLPIPLTENDRVQTALLREATQEDHSAVESSFSFPSTGLNRTQYVATLERLYGIVQAWESLAEDVAPPELQAMVRARARRELLAADIKFLGGSLPTRARVPLPRPAGRSEFLGALYVMEGSRLGGQFLARHVDDVLGLTDGRGTAYFRGFGDKTGSMWKELLAVFETQIPEEDSEIAIAVAKQTFRAFGAWMSNTNDLSREDASELPGRSLRG